MSRMKSLIKTSFLGGLTVILPVAILVFVFSRFVHQVDVPVEDAMRSIISCGAGSAMLIDAYRK